MLFKVLQLHYVWTGWYGCIYRFLPRKTADMSLANQNKNIDSGKWSINHAKWWHLWGHFMGPVNQANLAVFMVAFYRTCQSHLMATLLVGN